MRAGVARRAIGLSWPDRLTIRQAKAIFILRHGAEKSKGLGFQQMKQKLRQEQEPTGEELEKADAAIIRARMPETSAGAVRPKLTMTRHLSESALNALPEKEILAYHQAWAEYYAQEIRALGHEPETAMPRHFKSSSIRGAHECSHRGLLYQFNEIKLSKHGIAACAKMHAAIVALGHAPVRPVPERCSSKPEIDSTRLVVHELFVQLNRLQEGHPSLVYL
jgi:hypothetical protein